MSAEFDQLVAQFEQFQSRLKRVDDQFAAVGQMQEELADLEAVATSPDRSVTVVAGPSGAVKDIRLTDLALRQSPQALSAALMGTLQRAVAEAARRQAGIVERAIGADLHLTDQVLETQAQLFGTTTEELRAMTEQADQPQTPSPQQGQVRRPVPSRPAAEEPDDFSQQNFLRQDQGQAPASSRPQPRQDGRYLNLYDGEDR